MFAHTIWHTVENHGSISSIIYKQESNTFKYIFCIFGTRELANNTTRKITTGAFDKRNTVTVNLNK